VQTKYNPDHQGFGGWYDEPEAERQRQSTLNKWAEENSSPAAHQLLRAELAGMCAYALAVDLRFLGGYCSYI
jgi:hypothetical protein